jgi:hypothetical protein
MCLSGSKTVIMRIIMAPRPTGGRGSRRTRCNAIGAWCAAGPGSTYRCTCVRRPATGSTPSTASTSSAFVLSRTYNSLGPFQSFKPFQPFKTLQDVRLKLCIGCPVIAVFDAWWQKFSLQYRVFDIYHCSDSDEKTKVII